MGVIFSVHPVHCASNNLPTDWLQQHPLDFVCNELHQSHPLFVKVPAGLALHPSHSTIL